RGIDLHVGDVVRLGHHGHGRRGGVDAALRLGRGHALHAMAARLELEPGVRALAHDAGDDFLVAARLAGAFRHHLHLPAMALGEARVHAEEVAGEERALVAAGAGADLEEEVLLVVGIAWDEHALEVELQLGELRARGADLLLGEFAHRRVPRHFLRGVQVLRGVAIRDEGLDHGEDLGALLRELAEIVDVLDHRRVGKPRVDLLQPRFEAREPAGDGLLHCSFAGWSPSASGKRTRTAFARASRSPSEACESAWVGWCMNLLASPLASDSSTAAGSSPFASRAFAFASSISRYSSARRRSSTIAGTAARAPCHSRNAAT